MSIFDKQIARQQEQTQIRQELRAALKQAEYFIQLSFRTGKQQHGYNVQMFINQTEISR